MTEKQEHILRHSLGVPKGGGIEIYRNHFCTGVLTCDWPDCMALVKLGFMTRKDGSAISGGDYIFYVTDVGKDLVRSILKVEQSPLGIGTNPR